MSCCWCSFDFFGGTFPCKKMFVTCNVLHLAFCSNQLDNITALQKKKKKTMGRGKKEIKIICLSHGTPSHHVRYGMSR